MARYAFIDAPNTTGTTSRLLGFQVDWGRLYAFLTNDKWSCEKVFFYKGYKGRKEKQQLENKLGIGVGYTLRIKPTHIHPNKVRDVVIDCPECKNHVVHKEVVRGNQKSNCDVELAVDAITTLQQGDEALLFTGDGDFAYLVDHLIEHGVTVKLVSSQKVIQSAEGFMQRFSTRLKKILSAEGEASKRVQFVDINRWRSHIEKPSK